MKRWIVSVLILLILGLGYGQQRVYAAPEFTIDATTRCQICGMFVGKYPNWITVVNTSDGSNRYFDGMKDLLVFVLNSEQYDVPRNNIQEIWVKDYYSLDWFDARTAFFVVGSDVYGPMGHEFIPFSSKAAADNFQKDHLGKEILTFTEITYQRVQNMRVGQKMR